MEEGAFELGLEERAGQAQFWGWKEGKRNQPVGGPWGDSSGVGSAVHSLVMVGAGMSGVEGKREEVGART